MGSQTLEILRQGVWASVTGGWFYDPYQGVFSNIVHLYLWLFLVCSPFVAYLYFPRTWVTWCIYCVLTSLTILLVKLANMALHRLYDRAQTMSEANLKDPFIKVTKETEKRSGNDEAAGIELKVIHGDTVIVNATEQAINEASEGNSMMSIDNVNSVMDLKVDVHRKNSSESMDMSYYAPLMAGGGSAAASQHDQHSTNSATASVSKSIRSSSVNPAKESVQINPADIITKYLSVYPEQDDDDLSPRTSTISVVGGPASGPCPLHPHLWRKSSEVFKRRHHRRRLERQSSLDAGGSASGANKTKLLRNQSDTIATSSSIAGAGNAPQSRRDTYLHTHAHPHGAGGAGGVGVSKSASVAVVNTSAAAAASSTPQGSQQQQQQLRLNTSAPAAKPEGSNSTGAIAKGTRLQRHRSSETHDERLKQQQRGLFMPIHHEQQHSHLLHLPRHQRHHSHHNPSSAASSSSAIADGMLDGELMELGGSVEQQQLPSWILGSSSDVYIEDDNFTKSDFGIEQLDGRTPANAKARATFLLQQQQHLNAHYQHQQRYSAERFKDDDGFFPQTQQMHEALSHPLQQLKPVKGPGSSLRKDSNSTKSALQLPALGAAASGHLTRSSGVIKRRRHSNAAGLSRGLSSGSATARALAALTPSARPTVRRIKSAALEISCPRPSVSNLSPHPNSLEAISGQQQIKNPPSALLPPPSKCMVRNPHYNLCPKFGGSGESMGAASSGSSLNFGVDPIVEQVDDSEKSSLDRAEEGGCGGGPERLSSSSGDNAVEMLGAVGPDPSSSGGRLQAAAGEKVDGGEQRHGEEEDDAEDDFKYFDDNWENILTNMKHNCLELDQLEMMNVKPKKEQVLTSPINEGGATVLEVDYGDEEVPGAAATCLHHHHHQQQHRQRLHSSDSETETNNGGSQSPLLSKKKKACWAEVTPAEGAKAPAGDSANRHEGDAAQRHKSAMGGGAGGGAQAPSAGGLRPIHLGLKGETDSGCPSSDCEQISSSSKDMLLSGMEAEEDPLHAAAASANEPANSSRSDVETGRGESSDTTLKAKSQGAIPKDMMKYREVDETRVHRSAAVAPAASSSCGQPASMQVLKHRGGSGNTKTALPGGVGGGGGNSSSSSSPSSRSPSVDSLTTDIRKMLWIMHGGSVDDKGRPVYGYTPDGQAIPVSANAMPPPNFNACELYRGALNTPKSNALLCENFKRLQAKLSQSEISGECGDAVNGQGMCSLHDPEGGGAARLGVPSMGVGPGSSAGGLMNMSSKSSLMPTRPAHSTPNTSLMMGGVNGRSNVYTSTGLSIHGLINVMNDERVAGSGSSSGGVSAAGPPCTRSGSLNPQSRGSGGSGPPVHHQSTAATITNAAAAAALLNSEVHPQVDSYYEYLRPACILTLENPVQPKSFYKYHFKCFGYERDFKISMDRLELLSLFDRDLHWMHVLFSVVLCFLVAYVGATILQLGFYQDVTAFVFCVVIASAQYSLVKSVQPDAASPIHGFNKTVAYSRAIYFTLCGSILLLLVEKMRNYRKLLGPVKDLCFFGMHYSPVVATHLGIHIMFSVLLLFPLIFSLGLFPQANTFLMYLMEQIDMHVFGGNAAGSLIGSILCVLRSVLGVLLIYGPLYAALAEAKGTQFILFSFFCAMLIPLGYHLSRSASDFSHIWALLKNCIVSSYHDNDDDVSAAAMGRGVTKSPGSGLSQKRSSDGSLKRKKSVKRQETDKSTGTGENIEMATLGAESKEGKAKKPSEPLDLKSVGEDGDEEAGEEEEMNFDRKSVKSKASSLASSSQTLAKTLSSSRKAITCSNSLASVADEVEEEEEEDHHAGSAELQRKDESEEPVSEKPLTESSRDATTPYTIKDIEEVFELVTEELPSQRDERDVKTAPEPLQTTGDDLLDKDSSSSTTHPCDISTLTAGGVDGLITSGGPSSVPHASGADLDTESDNSPDPLPRKLHNTVHTRLKNDLVVTAFLALVVFSLHCSTVFTVLQPDLNIVLYAFTGALGFLLHYIIPQMRKHMPWLCFSRPILRQNEYGLFEVSKAAKVMWFEKVYIYLCMLERNVLFPLLAISALTADTQTIVNKYGLAWGSCIVAVCAMKFVRNSYSDATNQYLIVLFTVLFFRVDFAMASETFLIDYFFVSLAYRKSCDFLLKLQFIVTYIAPWQITWGSAFHAFAQPFSVPHSAMLFLQAGISAILSTPLNPFLGSAIFMTSYVRPIKFWERDYNTRRIDHSNTRLSSQLERDLGADDNNLNSIFYEHLTRSLQHSLCGDLIMGRWGNVNQGDCFVLASDYLNCLVHIIELGNGLCTFQMRGLEFRGTYCQQREVEAITEDVEDNDGCCCCDPGHLPRMLSVNAMFSTRWLAWQVVAAKYVLEGYSISDNLASATLQVFEYRKVLITYYIKSIIYYVIKSNKLEDWLESAPIQEALQHTMNRQFADLDPIFNFNLDEDFDFRAMGITRSSFCFIYLNWINFCYDKRMQSQLIQAGFPNPVNMAHTNTPNAANDSKSTPNLSTTTTPAATAAGGTPIINAESTQLTASVGGQPSTPQVKSQSQQQLRMRPQKSTTMSDSATTVLNNHSNEHMATSQSFANISRQTSESAPGLSAFSFTTHPSGASAAASTSSPANGATQTGPSIANAACGGAGGGTAFYDNPNGLGGMRLGGKSSGRFMRHAEMMNGGAHNNSGSTPVAGRSASVEENGGGRLDDKYIKLNVPSVAKDSPIVSLCLALSLLARRSLATASHSSLTGVEFFLHGLHALFKGDFRITSPRDEWVFADMDLLHSVVAPAVKMALKLQQDHISNPDEFLDPNELYDAIDNCSRDLVISHEADPVWRSAVLRGAPNLLALRHVMEDGSDEYRIIRLTKRFLSFRVIKLNRECVRGLWAGQQQELIYLRNRNPERGSIQNAKQALRNIINSSCDQPIGYPIYVSPLTTSYADTNEQLKEVIGGPITPESIRANVMAWWHRFRERCRQGCSSGSGLESNVGVVALAPGSASGGGIGGGPVYISAPLYNTLRVGILSDLSFGSHLRGDGNALATMRSGEMAVMPLKPISTTLLADLLKRDTDSLAACELLQRRSQRGEAADAGGGASGSGALRKSQTHSQSSAAGVASTSMSAAERERRATLPIAATNFGFVGSTPRSLLGEKERVDQVSEKETACPLRGCPASNSPRYAKISSSSGNLGIGNIITTPGDYPRKSKGPICLTAAAAASAKEFHVPSLTTPRKPSIDLFKRVMIVNESEIFECLDSGNRIDVVWPNEEIRRQRDESPWLDWEPHAGMVGRVVHYWVPYHSDERFRSHINDIVYLLEIGEHYVPVGEYGLQEYNDTPPPMRGTITGGECKRRHHPLHPLERQEYADRRVEELPERGLTPILGSSAESPTSSHLGASCSRTGSGAAAKIKAVSSSSSEDELGLETLEMQRREMLLNMWKMIAQQTSVPSAAGTQSEQAAGEQRKESLKREDAGERSAEGSEEVLGATATPFLAHGHKSTKAGSEESLLAERKEQLLFEDLRLYLHEMRVANRAMRRKALQQGDVKTEKDSERRGDGQGLEDDQREEERDGVASSDSLPPAPPPSSSINTPDGSTGGSEESERAEEKEQCNVVVGGKGGEQVSPLHREEEENASNAATEGASDV